MKRPIRLFLLLLLTGSALAPGASAQHDARAGDALETARPVRVLPRGAVVAESQEPDGPVLVVNDPDEAVQRIVVFETPPLAHVPEGAGKVSALTAAAAAIDAEHARFRADVAVLDGAAAVRRAGGPAATEVRRSYRTALNGVAVATTRRVADELAALPYVRGVYEDRRMEASGVDLGAAAPAPSPGAVRGGGRGVVVAIIDTGVDYGHPALGGGIGAGFKVIGGHDFIDDDADPMDENGHGTHVAGIVAGHDPAGFAGVAPEASLLAYRVLDAGGTGPTSGVIAAIERALDPDGDPATDDAADILNLSLGAEGHPDDPAAQAVDAATAAGALVVVAAGNDGRSFAVNSPGVARTALTVGAVDREGAIAWFSSRGPVAATFESKPEIVAPGVGIRSSVPGGYEEFDGTSMATPHVAGVAALLLETHPEWDPATVKSALVLSARDAGEHLWIQGSGRVDAAAAAALPAVVTPSGLSFGNLDPTQPTPSFQRTLTIRNLGAQPQTYTVASSGTVPGAALTITPSSVTVAAGEAATVEVSARFDAHAMPFPQDIDVPYSGHVTFTGGGTVLRVPFSVTKTPQLVLRYDQPPSQVLVLSGQGGVAQSFQPSDVVSFALPAGTYDVLSLYNVPQGDGYTLGVHFTSEIAVTGKHDVAVARGDVRHPVSLEPLDRDGQPLPIEYTLLRLVHASGYSSYMHLQSPVFYISDVSTRLTLEALVHSLSSPSGVDYVVPLHLRPGISGPVALRNDPSAFREVRSRFRVPPHVRELFVVPFVYKRLTSALSTDESWYSEQQAEHHRLGPPFERTVLYSPIPSASFGFPHHAWSVFDTTEEDRPVTDDGGGNLVAVTPPLAVSGDAVDVFAHRNFDAPVRSVRDDVFEERFGDAPVVFSARTWNTPQYVRFDLPYRSAFFYGRDGEIVGGGIEYALVQGDAPVESGRFANVPVVRFPFLYPAGPYRLRVAFSGGYVDDRPVRAAAELAFDNSPQARGDYDPDPPHLGGITLTSGGAAVDALDPAQESAVVVTVRDTYNADTPAPKPVGAVRLAVRRLGERAWQDLAAQRQDETFTAAWPSSGAPGYYDLRIVAHDEAGNTLTYEVAPGFRVGAAENRAPAPPRLVAPAADAEIRPDTLTASVRFAWDAAADPDAGQLVRYVFRLAGTDVDTTLVTSDTAVHVDLAGRLAPGTTYTWRVTAVDGFDLSAAVEHTLRTTRPRTDADPADDELPTTVALGANYPNPFNPSTTIPFALPAAGDVRLEVYDALGRRVAVLAEGTFPAGRHTASWDAAGWPSGLYFVRLRALGAADTRTVSLLK